MSKKWHKTNKRNISTVLISRPYIIKREIRDGKIIIKPIAFLISPLSLQSVLNSLHRRRLEVVGERETGARGRRACLLFSRPFSFSPTTSKRLLRKPRPQVKHPGAGRLRRPGQLWRQVWLGWPGWEGWLGWPRWPGCLEWLLRTVLMTRTTTHDRDNKGDRDDWDNQAPVDQQVDNAIHSINHYPLDSAIGFPIR